MFVLVEEIRDEGLTLERELGTDFLADILLGEGPETGFEPAAPAKLRARFDRVGGKLLLTGDTRVKVSGQCRRCLADLQLEVPVHFLLDMVPAAKAAKDEESEGEIEADQANEDAGGADEETYEGRQIDLGSILREQILLALPMDAVCREECKGLCTVCGQDLNVKECGCQRKIPDPRWAALKDIKLKK